jgi:hypothetical protein
MNELVGNVKRVVAPTRNILGTQHPPLAKPLDGMIYQHRPVVTRGTTHKIDPANEKPHRSVHDQMQTNQQQGDTPSNMLKIVPEIPAGEPG